jgi:hypothetical protein
VIKQDDAERGIVAMWHEWRAVNLPTDKQASGIDALMFFGDLRSKRPDLLLFRYNGDKWQRVHGWLLHRRLVID